MSGLSSNIISKKAIVFRVEKWPSQDLVVEEKEKATVAPDVMVKAVRGETAAGLGILRNPRQLRWACARSLKGTFLTMAGTELLTP